MAKAKKITYLLREALSTIMKHTKLPRFLIFGGVVLAISLVIVLGLSNNLPLEDYFEENPDELARIVDVLHQNKREGYPISLNPKSDVRETVSNTLSDDIVTSIHSVFSNSKCNSIYASTTRSGSFFCRFSFRSREKVIGIAFVGDNSSPNTTNSIFSGLLVSECTFIADEWVYFEYYTSEGEKKIPG